MVPATIGSVVIAKNVNPSGNNGSDEAPAILTRVWGRNGDDTGWTVNAKVIRDGHTELWITSVVLFDTNDRAAAYVEQRRADSGVTVDPLHLLWPERV